MKQLYLMRHGVAKRKHVTQSDFDMPLTEEGIRLLELELQGIKLRNVSPELIVSSPLNRARETAEIVAKHLNPSLMGSLVINKLLVPDGRPQEVVSALFEFQHFQSILVVGHQPLLGSVAAYLDRSGEDHFAFAKGSMCLIELNHIPESGSGKIKWLLSPEQLIEEGRR